MISRRGFLQSGTLSLMALHSVVDSTAAQTSASPKALVFDVFGTVVDWRTSVAAEVDMSKVNCKEVGALPAAKTIGVAMWVNGYVHGKAGSAMVDSDQAQANAAKVAAACKKNPDATVADVIEVLAKS